MRSKSKKVHEHTWSNENLKILIGFEANLLKTKLRLFNTWEIEQICVW